MSRGWFKIHRKIEDNELWFMERFDKAHAWVDLIMLANHKPRTICLRGKQFKLQRGQLAWSVGSLARRWSWNERTVDRFLLWLESREMCRAEKTNYTTVITIQKYSEYQSSTEQDTEQNTEQDTDRQECKEWKEQDCAFDVATAFASIWKEYPRRLGKKAAERHFRASVKTPEDFERIKKALASYRGKLAKDKTEERYIQHGSTWFNNWQDWIEEPTSKPEAISPMKLSEMRHARQS